MTKKELHKTKQLSKAAQELQIEYVDLLTVLKELGIEKLILKRYQSEKLRNVYALEEDEYEKVKTFLARGSTKPIEKARRPATATGSAVEQPTKPTKKKQPQLHKPHAKPTKKAQPSIATSPKMAPAVTTAVSVIEPEVKPEPPPTRMPAPPVETLVEEPAPKPSKIKLTGQPRPPVVAVLGHVDHGKTTLLDKIRKTRVAEGETGGITQSIGAYQVEYKGQKITFIDTPGHRAFSGMRARGAQVTDIAVLVIAADDGIMEQTREALAHARAAQVPILVVLNKMDKPGVDLNRVKKQLHDENLTAEDWGGDTITVPLSALTGQGIEDLLEMILLVAELEELRADPKRPVQGTIIESHLDPARGPVATAIIKDGTLRERQLVVAGTTSGRIRALLDDRGKRVPEALPGSPVQILGLSEVPAIGIPLEAVENPPDARELVETRKEEQRRARLQRAHRTWEDALAQSAAKHGLLKLIVKADTLGSLEALTSELQGLEINGAKLELVFSGVGNITESDVLLAASSEGEIGVIGFRVALDPKAKELADQERIIVRIYEIIYQLTDEVRKALKGLIEPEYEETKLGEIEVRNVFKIPKVGVVAGCYVKDGQVTRSAQIRVMRNGALIFQGKIQSLKRFDQDVREVSKDMECGIRIEGFNDVKIGDRLEAFTVRLLELL